MTTIEKIKAELERLKNDWASLDDELTDTMVAEYDYLLDFLSTLEKECGDFPTTDEEMAKFLATHPKVEVPEKYKTPDWMFEKSEKPIIPNDLEKAARLYAIPHYMKDIDVNYIEEYPYDTGLEVAFIAGAKWDKEQMQKEKVKWLVDEDYDEPFEKGQFILGSVGIGYNGYYIPYSDLLKLPKDGEK